MPNEQTKKTKSAHSFIRCYNNDMNNMDYNNSFNRHKGVGVIVFGLIVVLLVAASSLLVPSLLQPTIKLQLGDGFFRAKVIKNSDQEVSLAKYEEKIKDNGEEVLGVTDDINIVVASEAVLIVFPNISKWNVSLKDLRRSVDIVWLDENKKVSYIVKNVSPSNFYTEKIESKVESAYILKLAAGMVDKKLINIGTQASFVVDGEG